MKAIIKIDMDNAAFAEGNGDEIARILRELADSLAGCELGKGERYNLKDANGNRVGALTTTTR
jgi:hypothetical protein